MIDLLLPDDDRTVLIQLVLVVVSAAVALRVTWRHASCAPLRDRSGLIVLAGMGIRALH